MAGIVLAPAQLKDQKCLKPQSLSHEFVYSWGGGGGGGGVVPIGMIRTHHVCY